jgi:uncharacterized protein
VHFAWDIQKARANLRKHGVSFEEAQTVFEDSHLQLVLDVAHSDDEERFIAIGLCNDGKLLSVCHCYRGDDVIRVFSARRASASEIKLYR